MRILFFGAGVLGSLYAARLQECGHDVTLLARGQRLADLREHGVVLVNARTGRRSVTRVAVTDRLEAGDAYDWIVVLVRKNQLADVLPLLAANYATLNILLMTNNAAGVAEIAEQVGRGRLVLGFPGAGGTREGHVVRYNIVSGLIQPTTVGELDGRDTSRLRFLLAALRSAGFPTVSSGQMDAWLKTHVAVVSPVANALYLSGGDNYRLAQTRDGVVLMVRAIKESFRVLRALGVPVTPFKYRLLPIVPEPLLVAVMQRALATEWAKTVLAEHANAARDEMQQLADEFQVLVRTSDETCPALDTLSAYLDRATVPMPAGRARLALNWRGVWVLAATASVVLGWMAWMWHTEQRSGS